ncbi:hypothetical protein J8J27_21195, partial [Mycobacterium tuberculosis]|nr:hypothetical protein [Mycobacterium tuberculosis]
MIGEADRDARRDEAPVGGLTRAADVVAAAIERAVTIVAAVCLAAMLALVVAAALGRALGLATLTGYEEPV